MPAETAIEWTESTWNPVTGCSKVSPGCAHCYAERIELRFARSLKPWTPENAAENVKLHPGRLDQPLRWRRPRMVFVNSMSDLFHEEIPDEFITEVFTVMGRASHHTFQVLTKRPERARELYESRRHARNGHDEVPWLPWPLPNVWLGVSIENARFTWRADVLRKIPATVRFVSAEPLLGSLFPAIADELEADARDGPDAAAHRALVRGDRRALDLAGINWLIAGGESGPRARPMRIEWARELRDACLAAGVAFFFKQWGGPTPKAGGRLLDEREWNEMPAVAYAANGNGIGGATTGHPRRRRREVAV